MKLKELKKLIEGCHPEDLNNEIEAIVISKKNKICILRLSAIGDCCHVLGAINSLRNHDKDADITWIIGKNEYQIFREVKGVTFQVIDKKNLIKNYISNENYINLESIDNYNLNGDYIESQAFGFLAIRSFLNLPISFSTTTGCKEFTVGGKLVENF